MGGLSRWAARALIVLVATGCAAPRSQFKQAPWVVAVAAAEIQGGASPGCAAVRLTAREGRCTLVWRPMGHEQVLEAVSLAEVDAGLVLDSDWDSGAPQAQWITVSECRSGYRLLLNKQLGAAEWLSRWESLPVQ